MSSGNSSLDSTNNGDTLTRSYSMSTADRARDNVPTRDYDGLKSQCDKAMHELQLLRRQHSETVRRCEHTMKELEFYRGQHSAALAQLESATQESSSLRTKYVELVTDLRSSKQEGDGGGGGDGGAVYLLSSKYDALKEEYESLRKRYDDLIASHSSAVDKLELAQEEVGRLKKQCEDMVSERNIAVRERNGLKQQCTAAIRQWDIALRERNEYQEALVKVQQQHEEAVKEINQAMAVRMKASKDLKRLTEERNAAMQEYSLIMSERDTVHKEMEKLSEDLTQAYKNNKVIESDNKQLNEQKKTLAYQVETLKREIASALHDRDKALKECNDLRERFGEFTAKEESQRDSFKSRYDYAYRERDAGRKDLREVEASSLDLFAQERVDNLDQANQEIERLRKHADKVHAELHEALEEAEVCKRRRDWAFSERDKIVMERESIRTLCDRLRKERDRAVSELAEALRDSDEVKRERNETWRELKVLRERLAEEKESRLAHLVSHNLSHDSAIDTDDPHDHDTDILTIDLNGMISVEDVGLELVGGRDDPHYPNDTGIYVSSVAKGSLAEGKLRPNDCIVRVNNVDCSNVSKRFVVEAMKTSGNTAVMVVRRRRLYTTQLQVNNYDHGLSLEAGIYICRISPGSLAAKEPNLAPGDRVLSINNKAMEGVRSAREAMAILNEPSDVVTITTLKSGPPPASRQLNASTQTHYRPAPLHNTDTGGGSKWSGRSSRDLEEKKLNRNSSPVTFDQERDDAIAELDNVIESYRQRTSVPSSSRNRNGGTWPKARCGGVIEEKTGTIVEASCKRKERGPLSMVVSNYPLAWCNKLDLSVKSGNMGKEVLEYYVKRKSKCAVEESRIQSRLYGSPPPPHVGPYLHPHSHTHSPPPMASSDPPRSFCFEPSYTPLTMYHTHSPSVDSSHYHKVRALAEEAEHGSYHYEGGTFPRKKENPRFRIPSNPSVASKSSGGKVSSGSIEKSERGSPMPTFHVEVLSPGLRQNKTSSLPDYCWPHKPYPGELRRVHIDKSVEPLGIQISCLESGGVFVSTVNEGSLAAQVGLQVGDQLLEVCGINMRSATYQLAANVLRQCGNSITMLVQYSPDKYQELEGTGSSSSGGSKTRSGSPTPCNSPRANRKSVPPHAQLAQAISNLASSPHEPRHLTIETPKCSNLGMSLVGGNAVGIYVHSVEAGSVAALVGLRTGDRILEYNGADLREATAEEAAYQLAKPADRVNVLAQYSIHRYNDVKDKPGDSMYMRALFDRVGDIGDSMQLRFRKDDVLYVDNTMFNGVPGNWRAWLLDDDGCKQQCGIIPSKYKVEEELVVRRSLGDLEGGRGTRRSFFRRKKHQRTDSKELASFSNMSLGWCSDSGTLHEESSYQRVTRLNYPVFRPVLIVGPLSDSVTEKLIQDFPDKFVKCVPEVMHCSQATMDKGLHDNLFVDYRKKGSFFECTSVSAVKDMADKKCHCVIDVSLASVERLHRHQIYPIVLLIKFKSTKQIREVKDTRYSLDKVSAKAAKEMYEHASKLESEYSHYISAVIPAGVNVAYMCTQIKAAVDQEQNKTLWVPC